MARKVKAFNVKKASLYQELIRVHGIGRSSAYKICDHFSIPSHTRISELTKQQIYEILGFLSKNFLIEADLTRETTADLNRLASIPCYRGMRHKLSLPLRGQRTSTNAKTQKRIGRRIKRKKNI